MRFLLILFLVLISCTKPAEDNGERGLVRYYEFTDPAHNIHHIIKVDGDEITLFLWRGDCWRPARDGDPLRVPEDPDIIILDTHIEILDLKVRADAVKQPWNLIFCE